MMDESYKIQLVAEAIPLNNVSSFKHKLFRHAGSEAFIVGENFQMLYTVTNIGSKQFDEKVRKLSISIQWANGQSEFTAYQIKELEPGKSQTFEARWGVLAPGFALFSAMLEKGTGGSVFYQSASGSSRRSYDTAPLYRDERNLISLGVSFFSIYAQTTEEFYQYWAMMFTLLALLVLVGEKLYSPLFNVIKDIITRIACAG